MKPRSCATLPRDSNRFAKIVANKDESSYFILVKIETGTVVILW